MGRTFLRSGEEVFVVSRRYATKDDAEIRRGVVGSKEELREWVAWMKGKSNRFYKVEIISQMEKALEE